MPELTRDQIAKRIALEIKDGDYVNLGIGIPTLVANFIPSNIQVCLQSENGMLGMGGFPSPENLDPDLINAGKQTVSETKGCCYFSSSSSFAMIRGGHIDVTVLGAFEVDQMGNIASWMIPNKLIKGMGGAMDLVASANNIIVAMQHANKQGESKLLKQCQLPLTGINCIKKIVTDLAVLTIENNKFVLQEKAPGITVEQIKALTAGDLIIPNRTIPDISI